MHPSITYLSHIIRVLFVTRGGQVVMVMVMVMVYLTSRVWFVLAPGCYGRRYSTCARVVSYRIVSYRIIRPGRTTNTIRT